MCFSATASFTASGVLALAGIVAIVKKRGNFLPIALIPIFFAIQQFFEGLVWLNWNLAFVWIYLFFAYAFWPIWIPLSLSIYDVKRRRLFLKFLLWGIFVSCASFGYLIWHASLIEPTVVKNSICYSVGCLKPTIPEILLYSLVTILPPLLSSNNSIKLLGVFVLIAAVLAYIFYFYAFASVWCFFAALISLWIAFLAWRI